MRLRWCGRTSAAHSCKQPADCLVQINYLSEQPFAVRLLLIDRQQRVHAIQTPALRFASRSQNLAAFLDQMSELLIEAVLQKPWITHFTSPMCP
jgi:hypothetical protein